MRCKTSWKVTIVILTLISILLLLLILKLVDDKPTRASPTEFIDNVESVLETGFKRLNLEKWSQGKGNVTFKHDSDKTSSIDSSLSVQSNYNQLLMELKVNVSEEVMMWEEFNTSSLLGRKIRVILNLPTFLLEKSKINSLTDIIHNVTRVQDEETHQMREKKRISTYPAYSLPKHVVYCKDQISNESEWAVYSDSVGRDVKPEFSTFVKLMNEEALLNKCPDAMDYWITSTYETSVTDFELILQSLWNQLRPLYQEFHAHLRGELRFIWEKENISKDGPIPAHFLQRFLTDENDGSCSVLYEATRPYPGKAHLNLTQELKRRRYIASSMSTFADDFLSSMGFPLMLQAFWFESIFRKPSANPHFNCQPQLIRFDKKQDVRLSLCGESDERTLRIVNQLMVQGSLDSLLFNQSFLIRHFANPHVRESIEEALLLAMSNQAYFRRMGILEDYDDDMPYILNVLYRELYDLFPLLTRSLVFHEWESKIYRHQIQPTTYNNYFWKLRLKYEGVSRNGFGTFDPAVYKNIVLTPAQNIQPFLVSIMKYEIFRSLCILAEDEPPFTPFLKLSPSPSTEDMRNGTHSAGEGERRKMKLYNCDLFGRSVTVERLSTLMNTAAVTSWPRTLGLLNLGVTSNGSDGTLDASAMLDYFRPLLEYLQEMNKRRELPVGW